MGWGVGNLRGGWGRLGGVDGGGEGSVGVRKVDEDAYREYVVNHLDPLRRTAYLLCRNWHTADDLVSVTITKLYRNWGRAARVESLDAYVRQILVNTWRDEGRRPWRRERATERVPDRVAAGEPEPAGQLGALDLLQALPPRQRAAVVLRFYCDLSIEQTAAALGCTTGTVKSLTSRGLAVLRATTPSLPAQ